MDANSASPLDPQELGGLIADLVHEHVERALPLVVGRVQTAIVLPEPVHGKDGAPGPKGEPGDPGVVDPEIVRLVAAETIPAMVDKAQRMLEERVDAWKPELKGEPGRDGKDVDPEVVHVMAAEAVTELVEGFSRALATRFAQADGVA